MKHAHGICIHMDADGVRDQYTRKNDSKLASAAQENPLKAFLWTATDAHAAAHVQIGMGFGAQRSTKPVSEFLYLLFRQRRRASVESNQTHYARNSQNTEPLAERNANENIAGE